MESNNPYAPPKAAVEDVSGGEHPPRPPEVTKALQLLWAAVAVSFVSGAINAFTMETPGMPKSMYVGFMVFGWVVGILIVWWIFSSIGKGKNWARIVQLVFFILSILGLMMTYSMPQKVSGIVWALYAVQMGLNLWAVILLFAGRGGEWFREMKNWI